MSWCDCPENLLTAPNKTALQLRERFRVWEIGMVLLEVLTQDVNVSGPSNAVDAGKALVFGRVQADRIGTRDGCRRGREGPESQVLPAGRSVMRTV